MAEEPQKTELPTVVNAEVSLLAPSPEHPPIPPFKWKWRYLAYAFLAFIAIMGTIQYLHDRDSKRMTAHALSVGAQNRIIATIDCAGDSTHVTAEGQLYCGMPK